MGAMILIIAVGAVLLGALTVVNYRYAKGSPGGVDFLFLWKGTRSLLLEGISPYSQQTSTEINEMIYGAAAANNQLVNGFSYPLYAVIIGVPFALINDFVTARALWMTLTEVGFILLTFLSLRLSQWRIRPLMLIPLLLFSFLWYHGVRTLINGNIVILVALLLVGALLAIKNRADELAGVLLALTTIKLQVVLLVLVFIVIWAVNQRRGKLVSWLFGTTFLLAASAALIVPTWMLDNLREVIRYPALNPPGSPQAAFKEWWPWGERVGWALTAVMGLTILVEWWNNRCSEFRGFYWTVCLTLAAGQWTGIQTDPGNFIILFPALILVFTLLDERWRTGGRVFVFLSMLLLFAGIWALFLKTVTQVGGQPLQSPVMFFPLPAFLLLTLYWVRWWAVEPPSVWYDQLER